MIFNRRAVSLAVFGSLALEITTAAVGIPTDFCYNENGALVCIYYNDDLTCSMKLNGRSFRTTMSASLCASLATPHSSDSSTGSQTRKSPSLRPSASPIVPPIDENVLVPAASWPWGDSLPATAEDLKAKAEFVRLGGQDNIAPSDVPPLPTHAPVVPPLTDEITTAAISLPKDFCYNENGAEVCLHYYDDLKCDVKLNGRSFRTGISASFCASLAAPYSSDPSTGIQPTKSPSLQPTKSPSSQPTKSPSSQPTKSPSSQPTKPPSSQPTESPAPCFDGTDRNGGGNGHAFYYLPSGGGVVPSTDCAADFALEHRSGHDDFVEACGRPLVLDGRVAGAVRDVCRFTCGVCGDNGAPTTKAPTAAPSVDPFNAALKAAEDAQKEADEQKAAEEAQKEAQKEAEKAAKTAQKAAEKAQKEVEKAQKEAEKAVEKAQKEAEKAQQEAQKEAEEAAKNEYKEDTGVMLEEEEMVFLSLMYNRGDSEIASLAVRQRRGRRRAHTIRRRATATKTRRETMAK